MSEGFIASLITGAGVAGIWVISIIAGMMFPKSHIDVLNDQIADLKEQVSEWKEATNLANQRADDERRRADAAVEAAQTSNLLLAGIRRGISGNDR